MNIKVGNSFETTAVLKLNDFNGNFFTHFGINPKHKLHYGVDENENVVRVRCTITDVDLSIANLYSDKSYDENCVDYLAYFPFYKCDYNVWLTAIQSTIIIQPNIKVFNCCFPYGADASCFDKNNKRIGTICRLKVDVL